MNNDIKITKNMNLGQYSPLELMEGEINEEITERAKSKAQQRFMGMVDAYKKGDMPDASPAIKKAAKSMTKKEVKDFAKTKHKGLPEHVNEAVDKETEEKIRKTVREMLKSGELPKDGRVEMAEYYNNILDKAIGKKFDEVPNGDENCCCSIVDDEFRKQGGKQDLDGVKNHEDSVKKGLSQIIKESVESKYILFADTMKSGNSDFMADMEEQINNKNVKKALDYVPEEAIVNDGKEVADKKVHSGEVALEKDGYVFVRQSNSPHDFLIYKKTKNTIKENTLRKIIREALNNIYSTQGGMLNNYDIKNFKLFVRQNPELPNLPWGVPGSQENQEKNTEVLNQYKVISYKIYNALPEEATRESYHWLTNAYTYLKRGDIQNANYSYTKSIRLLVDALSKNNINENIDEISNDTVDSAYMKAMSDTNRYGYDDPMGVRRRAQAANLKKMRDERLGFDPVAMTAKMRQNGTSGDPSIDRRWATWQKNHNDRVAGNRVYDKERGRWITKQLEEKINESVHTELVKTLGKYTSGEATAEQANKAIMNLANSSNRKLKESLDDEMRIWEERDKSEFGQILKQLQNIAEDCLIDAGDAMSSIRTVYTLDGNEAATVKRVKHYLSEYDIILLDDNGNVDIEGSNSPEAAELVYKLSNLAPNGLNESKVDDYQPTHFAVNKTTGKIVNSWDYRGYDSEELRTFKRDYFIQDLIDNDLDPKQYVIMKKAACIRRGINPDDNSNWANV